MQRGGIQWQHFGHHKTPSLAEKGACNGANLCHQVLPLHMLALGRIRISSGLIICLIPAPPAPGSRVPLNPDLISGVSLFRGSNILNVWGPGYLNDCLLQYYLPHALCPTEGLFSMFCDLTGTVVGTRGRAFTVVAPRLWNSVLKDAHLALSLMPF